MNKRELLKECSDAHEMANELYEALEALIKQVYGEDSYCYSQYYSDYADQFERDGCLQSWESVKKSVDSFIKERNEKRLEKLKKEIEND